MAAEISAVRIQMLYKKAARLFWKSSDGPMVPGLQNGYALTVFSSESALTHAVSNNSYSQLFPNHEWKVGTAETTAVRLRNMFGIRRPLIEPSDIWDRYYLPFTDRLSKYQGDTKNLSASQCAFTKEVLIEKYTTLGSVAILMLPLIIGFNGKAELLEQELSEMIVGAGGTVHNDKKKQALRARATRTNARINLEDKLPDKLLQLSPSLERFNCEFHPELSLQSVYNDLHFL